MFPQPPAVAEFNRLRVLGGVPKWNTDDSFFDQRAGLLGSDRPSLVQYDISHMFRFERESKDER